ncbi:glycosyltransferase [Sphaerotilus montanus]|uniref:Glycosyltransferase involved in cell wall biosynthesis n=1 Tax=Sphaerotilus montanus TaxID=522889 RepID=A0A7Y9R2C3_9BURK|nr:glycosyltransferase [Sphaerotilus montanus]NYG33935.1 glycosyltransferase involved in cell wall biosynthesis [Sphaerotilus montanus]
MDPSKGGPAYSVRESSSILAARGHDVTVLTLDDAAHPPIDPRSLNFLYIPIGKGIGGFSFNIKYFFWLVSNRSRFDLTIIHGIWQWPSLAYRLARKSADKFIVMPHGSLDVWDRDVKKAKFIAKKLYWRFVELPLYRTAQNAFFTAEDELIAAQSQFTFSGVSGRVVPYGAVSVGAPRKNILLSDRYTFGYMGRIHEKKGIELLLDVFAKVVNEFPEARLRIAGTGAKDYVDFLKNKCQILNISKKVEWLGNVHGVTKHHMLTSIGLFVLPSFQENFGLAVAESLSVGTPVLLSEHVNVHKRVSAYSAGIVSGRTFDEFYAAMHCWITNPDLYQEFRDNSVKCFDNTMSLHKHVDCIEGVL